MKLWRKFLPMACLVAAGAAQAQMNKAELPPEVQPFVEPGTVPWLLESADLNLDGRPDYLLVLQRTEGIDPATQPDNERPLLILVRAPAGTLRLAARSERAIVCSHCGGGFGDPFSGIEAGPGTFTLQAYGGNTRRWSSSETFRYSRRYQSWHLVRVERSLTNLTDLDEEKSSQYQPPRDFGLIDIRIFRANMQFPHRRRHERRG